MTPRWQDQLLFICNLGESFTYSPSQPSPAQNSIARESPLQDFLKKYHAKKVLDCVQKELRETKTALDNEKGETLYLKAQVESMTMRERKLRQDLEATKSKLFSKANGQESIVSMTDYHDLQEKYNNFCNY